MKRKRATLVLVVLLVAAIQVSAAEKWFDHYKSGVTAVNAKSYRAAVDSLQKAIAVMPNEGTGVRAGKEIIVYVPHFWLGIAKFNAGDVDGALREWRTSEEQGVIARTEYYANLKDWVARAQTEKQRIAADAAAGPKKAADTAISRALALQVDALSAGGDRGESYRSALRKLQEALNRFHQAGTDVAVYQVAEQTAQEAAALFATAAEEGKKLRAARAAAPIVTPQPVKKPQPVPTTTPAPPPPAPVASEAEVSARIAVQTYRRHAVDAPRAIARPESAESERLQREIDAAKTDADFTRIGREAADRDARMARAIAAANAPPPAAPPVTETVAAPATSPDLRDAYRAFARGDLATAERLLTSLVQSRPTAEAYLLRGCARYTNAMLSRASLDGAAADFKTALQRNGALRLDRRTFSPKLVAFFEQVRGGS